MSNYTEEEKKALINAVNTYAHELDGLFVADNVRVMGMRERTERMLAEKHDINIARTSYALLADYVACEMEGTNGASWQFDTLELHDLINEI